MLQLLAIAVASQIVSETQGQPSVPQGIVVTGRSPTPAPEVEFDENAIAADGSDSIGELLENLQPFIDPSGNPPIVLINGKPAGFDTSIDSYPVEALAKVSVLQPNAARQYGASSGTRVINLVLKRKFASLASDGGGNLATSGGQSGENLGLSRDEISGETRWSAHVQSNLQSELLQSARAIPETASGFQTPVSLDGTKVTSALTQFAIRHPEASAPDVSDFETLQPSSRDLTIGINVARPVGGLAASISVDAGRSDSHGLEGMPEAAFPLPAGASQGNRSIIWEGAQALRSSNNVETFGASLSISGMVKGVQTSFDANVSGSRRHNLLDSGPDAEKLQQYADSMGLAFDPGQRFGRSFVDTQLSYTHSNNSALRINLQKAMVRLPTGSISWAFSANASSGHNLFRQDNGSDRLSQRSKYAQSGIRGSVSVPISSVGSPFHPFGDLSLDLAIGRQAANGGNAQTNYGASVTWIPLNRLQFRGSIDRAQIAPSPDQLNAPAITKNELIFDYNTQQYTQVAWTTGGNPLLRRGNQTNVSLGLLIKPLARHDLALNTTFRQFISTNSPMSFPELSPAIEQAFPDRVTRNSLGQLIALDTRPVSFQRQDDATLNSNLTLRMSGAHRHSEASSTNWRSDALQVNLSLSYQLKLWSLSLVQQSLPKINRLSSSGVSRHQLDFRLSVGKRAVGSTVTVNWRSSAVVTSSAGTFRVTPPVLLNISLFVNLDRLFPTRLGAFWMKKTKLSFDVENLFQGYRHIKLPDGSSPSGYSRDEADPIGRTIHFSLRKQF